MPEIVLSTLNAKYIHAAFGLRYLLANLGDLKERACLLEFDIHQRPVDVAEALLERDPRIIGLGVYIWNAQLATELAQILKKVAPRVTLIVGGPEVSYEMESQAICQCADYVIGGEADLKFAEVCRDILEGRPPAAKFISAEPPDLAKLELPYELYGDRDAATRIIYVEASRGCPFTCEFCLSSLDIPVRAFPLEQFLAEMEKLFARGVKHFKFVDRTFNLNLNASQAILEFCFQRRQPGMFFHFEMIPDRLPEGLRRTIARFPPGMLQFEVGIQSFNPEVSARIQRRQNYEKIAENLRFLREHTGVHVHADLIAGLPGENLDSFAHGFDQLVALGASEIQVGILKRLRGTPIVRHDAEWEMTYSPVPPYEILSTKTLAFEELQRLRRFARHWDLVANSGNFIESAPLIWKDSSSPFRAFMRWSQWLHARLGRSHGIALITLAEMLFIYLTRELRIPEELAARSLYRDYQRGGHSDKPPFLRSYIPEPAVAVHRRPSHPTARRQARHSSQLLDFT